MSDIQGRSSGEPVPPLELMAALSSLLIHDLSNHISIISGNAQFAELMIKDPERVATALKSIIQASELSTAFLKRCGDIRRGLAGGFEPGEIPELCALLQKVPEDLPGWTIELPGGLVGRIPLPARWVMALAREIIRETATPDGLLSVSRIDRPEHARARSSRIQPFTHMLEFRFSYQAADPFPFSNLRSRCSNLLLLAAHELIVSVSGWADFVRRQENHQLPTLFVPILENG